MVESTSFLINLKNTTSITLQITKDKNAKKIILNELNSSKY